MFTTFHSLSAVAQITGLLQSRPLLLVEIEGCHCQVQTEWCSKSPALKQHRACITKEQFSAKSREPRNNCVHAVDKTAQDLKIAILFCQHIFDVTIPSSAANVDTFTLVATIRFSKLFRNKRVACSETKESFHLIHAFLQRLHKFFRVRTRARLFGGDVKKYLAVVGNDVGHSVAVIRDRTEAASRTDLVCKNLQISIWRIVQLRVWSLAC